jgi:vacuolar-type H+-ATPase subunit F/Vma7
MGRLIVLTTPELAPGYELAGATTLAVESAGEAAGTLNKLLAADAEGDVIALHEPFYNALESSLRRRIESLVSPLIVALPGGEEARAEAERRAQHLRILWEAVGYQITFDPGAGAA